MDVASIGFTTELMIRRLAGSSIEDRGEWLVVRTPDNPSFRWGNFLLFGHPLRRGDAARWNARFAAEFPQATHRAFGMDATGTDIGDAAELDALRMEVEVDTVLTASRLTEPPAGGNVSCRRLAGSEDWAQAALLQRACYGDPDSPEQAEFRDRSLAESRTVVESGNGAWFGAFVEGRLVSALGIGTDGSGLARYQNVETHPQHRRRGLAARLVYLAGLHAVHDLGAATLVIVADPDGEAISMYRSLGFVDTEQRVQLAGSRP